MRNERSKKKRRGKLEKVCVGVMDWFLIIENLRM